MPLLTIPWVVLQYVIVVFPDHTHLLFYVILVLIASASSEGSSSSDPVHQQNMVICNEVDSDQNFGLKSPQCS